jgi:hypothetical protein
MGDTTALDKRHVEECPAMHHELIVSFGKQPEHELRVSADTTMAADEARRWLDDQFIAFDCEPLRASGKVLVADKLLAVAAAAGQATFAGQPDWARAFAAAAGAATGRPTVKLDLVTTAISF